jgi:hypothetical protein
MGTLNIWRGMSSPNEKRGNKTFDSGSTKAQTSQTAIVPHLDGHPEHLGQDEPLE